MDYTTLITSEHANKPKFMALVSALTGALDDVASLIASIPDAFDVDKAIGAQLDIVGQWVGIGRYISEPIQGVYFTWGDTANSGTTGWKAGSWRGGQITQSGGIEALPDDAYRILIKAKIATNNWDGSIPAAYAALYAGFGSIGAQFVIQDNQDMTIEIGVAGATLSALERALLTGGYLPLKPVGVRISKINFLNTPAPFFGWDSDTSSISGWDIGAFS